MSVSPEVIRTGEVWFASVDPSTGSSRYETRFRVDVVRPVLNGLFPPVISLGDDGRDTQPFASTIAFDDLSGGIGILNYDPATSLRRYWWGTADARRRRAVALPPLKTDRTNPHAGALPSSKARAGIHFDQNALTYVAWDTAIYAYDHDTESWTTAAGSPVHTLASLPTSQPVAWNGSLYWFTGVTISRFNGSTWTTINDDAVAGVVYGGQLWTVDASGNIERSSSADLSSVTTVTGSVRFSDDQPVGMLVYQAGDNLTVPYVVGKRRLYAIDPNAGIVYPAGPPLPPHVYRIVPALFGADNMIYIGQGMSVIQWNGQNAQNIGFDLDDGVPADIRGRIVAIVGSERDLFVLTSSAGQPSTEGETDPTDDSWAIEMPQEGPALSCLFIREGSGWHPIAVSEAEDEEATTMFLSFYDDKYRVWFAWGGTIYSIDLPFGLSSPLEEVSGTFEPSAYIVTPWIDFGYHESEKIGLMAQVRAGLTVSETEKLTPWIAWDRSSTWLPLLNADGSHGITTPGRHEFLIPASTGSTIESPPLGRRHDSVRFKIDLSRGDDETKTPVLVMIAFHALKVVDPVLGWDMELDLTETYNGLTPDEQWQRLLLLLEENRRNLLHFSYTDDASGETMVYAVKITGVGAAMTTGLRARGRVRLSISQVISNAA